MESNEVVKALGALAQSNRLDIFRALVVAGHLGMTPGRLAASLNVPAATLSFHLKELLIAGLVTQERESRHLIYRAAYGRMNDLLAYLSANCCEGEIEACAIAPCAC